MTHGGLDASRLGLVGLGNTLAGDDGAGNIVVSRLKKVFPDHPDVFFHNLETDPLELWNLKDRAESFIFIDAIAGTPPGRLVEAGKEHAKRAFAPSLHQMDITTVMNHICILSGLTSLEWTVWGITIKTPEFLSEDLSHAVTRAVDRLTAILTEKIRTGDYSLQAPEELEHL